MTTTSPDPRFVSLPGATCRDRTVPTLTTSCRFFFSRPCKLAIACGMAKTGFAISRSRDCLEPPNTQVANAHPCICGRALGALVSSAISICPSAMSVCVFASMRFSVERKHNTGVEYPHAHPVCIIPMTTPRDSFCPTYMIAVRILSSYRLSSSYPQHH